MMTKNRKAVYDRKWFDQECKIDKKNRRKEYNRKIRHMEIDTDSCSKGLIHNTRQLQWQTMG